MSNNIKNILKDLNPEFETLFDYIEGKVEEINKRIDPSKQKKELFSHEDTMLITYADQFSSEGKSKFSALNDFISDDLGGLISIVHILPFYPWTSDDGFSPVDYQLVDPAYGNWDDVEKLKAKKMFDCVFNHLSSENKYFKNALAGDTEAQQMFHIIDQNMFKSLAFQDFIPKVVRPRTSPLFTPFSFDGETKYVWTTFSGDQVDTNLSNPKMLKYILESFFLYIEKGATYFRVDAVPFIWKELGTNCSHHPKTYRLIQLFRSIIDQINKNLFIVTESNVPHHENISYWGDGENQAHIIYNFSLAPLIIHALTFKTNEYLNKWAEDVFDIFPKTTYLNFTATHDGIGMRGLEGIVPESDVKALCDITEQKDGFVGKKKSRDGTVRPYELNITWASFLSDEKLHEDEFIRKVVNSHAIVMFFPGIGAHYVHNFFATESWIEGREESGIPRRINRKKLPYPINYNDREVKVRDKLLDLIKFKSKNKLFSPKAGFRILDLNPKVLSFERFMGDQSIQVHFNLSEQAIDLGDIKLRSYDIVFK